jgi:DNA-binding winged helix-turn-helix (wHTH) protein/TolB-like protein/lipoprotein NlpI
MTLDGTHYSFGSFRLYPSEQLLVREEDPIPLAPKTFELLLALVESHGHLITREALMQAIWPDSFVEETNLTVNISLLRKALGEMPGGRPWIATIPKRGYRFDGPVVTVQGACAVADQPAVLPPAPVETSSPASDPAAEIAEAPAQPPQTPSSSEDSGPRLRIPVFIAAAVVVLLCVWLAVHLYRQHTGRQLSSLAVLPFQPLVSTTQDEYLGLGMTDALITRLGKLSHLVVRPLGAVRSFSRNTDPLAAGRQLHVEAVLDGTIEKIGDETRVAVRLWRVDDGRILWTGNFDEQNSSAFSLEDSISQKLAQALTLNLSTAEQQQLARPGTPNNAAYQLYTQGRFYWNKRSVESVQHSIELFTEAIQNDPSYAAAWSGLADAWLLAGSYGNSFLAPSVAVPKAREAAEKALALDPASAEAHTSLAYIRLTYDWDWAGAEQEFRRAIQINPEYVNAHHWYSHELVALGRLHESHEESETALALDPTDVLINEHMAWHHLMAREYDRAIPQANKAIELDPDFVQAHRVLALALLYTGRTKEACAEFEKGVELSHGDPVARAYLARCYAFVHRNEEARQIVTSLEQASAERYISAAEIAAIYVSLGDNNSALRWLDTACTEHSGSLIYLNADRVFDPLRRDAHFQSILARIHLTPLRDE